MQVEEIKLYVITVFPHYFSVDVLQLQYIKI